MCNSTDAYTFSFVAWADDVRNLVLDFEDPSNEYNRYGESSSPLVLAEDYIAVTEISVAAAEGASTVYLGGTLQMSAVVLPAEADYQNVIWSVVQGTGDATITGEGLLTGDSTGTVTVIATAGDDSKVTGTYDVAVGYAVGVSPLSRNTLKVYPNPAVNELNLVLSSENTLVAIYSSVGMKMEEVLVTGTEHKFNISNYASGIYFVK